MHKDGEFPESAGPWQGALGAVSTAPWAGTHSPSYGCQAPRSSHPEIVKAGSLVHGAVF